MKLRIVLVGLAGLLVAAVLWVSIGIAPGGSESIAGSAESDARTRDHEVAESAATAELQTPAAGRETIPVADSSPSTKAKTARPSEVETPVADATPPSVRGQLVDEEGQRIAGPGSWVALQSENGRAVEPNPFEAGAFEFRGLEAGRWRIDADAPGFEPVRHEFSRSDGEATTEIDVVLRRRPTVDVVLLTPKQEPFELAQGSTVPMLYATRESLESAAGQKRELRNECGRFHARGEVGLEPPHLGLLELTCETPMWASLVVGEFVLASKRVDEGVSELAFVLDPAEFARMFSSLRLRVVDEKSGQPVGLVMASLRIGEEHVGSEVGDEAGVIQSRGLRPGPGTVTLERDGYASAALAFEAKPGKDVELGDVKLKPIARGILRLTVTRPPGVESVTVSWAESTGEAPMSWSATSWSAGDSVDVPLDSGRWLVWADASAGERKFRTHDLEVEIVGGLTAESLALEPLVQVVIKPAEAERTVLIVDPAARAAIRRSYTISGAPRSIELSPGDYEFFVTGPEMSEQRLAVSVGSSGETVQLP